MLPDNLVSHFQRIIVGSVRTDTEGRHNVGAVTFRAEVFIGHHSRLEFEKHELNVVLVVEDDLGIDKAQELVAAECFDKEYIDQTLVDLAASVAFSDADLVLISRYNNAPRAKWVEEA